MEKLSLARPPSTSPSAVDPELVTATRNIGQFKARLNELFVGRPIQVNKPTLKDWHDLAGNIIALATGKAYTAPEAYTYGAFNNLMETVLLPDFRMDPSAKLANLLTQSNSRIFLPQSVSLPPMIAPPLNQISVPITSASSVEGNPSAFGTPPSVTPPPQVALVAPTAAPSTKQLAEELKVKLNSLLLPKGQQITDGNLNQKGWYDLARAILPEPKPAEFPEVPALATYKPLMPRILQAALTAANALTVESGQGLITQFTTGNPGIGPGFTLGSVPAPSGAVRPTVVATEGSTPAPLVPQEPQTVLAPTAAPSTKQLAEELKVKLNSLLLPKGQQITDGNLNQKGWYDLARAIFPEPKPAEFPEVPASATYKPLMPRILQAALIAANALTVESGQARIQGLVAKFTAGHPDIGVGFTLGSVPAPNVAVRTTIPLHRTQTVLPPLHPSLTYLASRPFQLPPLSHPVTAHNLALIFGDAWIEDTPFEGGNISTFINITIETLKNFIRDFPEPSLAGPLLNELLINFRLLAKISAAAEHQPSSEASIAFLIQEYSRIIHDLQPGQSVLLPGGWIGVDNGHNILYEIKCETKGVFSFSLFNTGAGISYHDHTFVDHKMKYAPALSVTDIPAANLDPTFLRTVFELKFIKPTLEKPYNAANVYEGILGLLGGRIVKSPLPRDPEEATTGLEIAFMSPQNAGTCARKSLEAVLRARLRHFLPLYKQYKFREKFAALASFLAANNLANPEDQKLLQRIVSKFARTILKLQQKGLVSEEQVRASRELQSQAEARLAAIVKLTAAPLVIAHDATNFDKLAPLARYETTKIEAAQARPEVKKLHLIKPSLAITDPRTLLAVLTEWKSYVDYLAETQESEPKLFFLQEAFAALPTALHQDFWQGVPVREIGRCVSLLHELGQTFFRACFNSPFLKNYRTRARALINTENIRAAAFILAKRSPELRQVLAGFSLQKPWCFNLYFHYIRSFMLTAEDNLRFHELLDFYEQDQTKPLKFFETSSPTSITEKDLVHKEPDLELMHRYLQLHPGLSEHILQNVLPTIGMAIVEGEHQELNALGLLYCNPEAAIPRLLPEIYQQVRDLSFMSNCFSSLNFDHKPERGLEFDMHPIPANVGHTDFKIKLTLGGASILYYGWDTTFPFTCTDEALQRMATCVPRDFFRENALLAYTIFDLSKSKLPPAEIRALAQIRSSNTLQMYEAMRFMLDHFSLMKEKDLQHYLGLCLFENYSDPKTNLNPITMNPQKTLREFPFMVRHIEDFLASALRLAGDDPELLSYFAKIAWRLNGHIELAKKLNPGITFPAFTLPDFASPLRRLFHTERISAAFKKEIALTLVQIKADKAVLNSSEIEDLLVYTSYLNLENKKDQSVLPEELSLALEVVHQQKNKIAEFLQRNPEACTIILNHTLSILGVAPVASWAVPPDLNGFTCVSSPPATLVFDFLEATFYQNKIPLAGLPNAILEHQRYKELFGTRTLNMVFQDPFYTTPDHSLRIKLDASKPAPQNLIIQKNIPKGSANWYQYVSKSEFDFEFLPWTITHNHTFWLSTAPGPKQGLVLDENNQPIYTLDLTGNRVNRIPLTADEPVFELVSQATSFKNFFFCFETIGYYSYFVEQGNPHKGLLELPRFGLRFRIDGQNAFLEEPRGYKLALNQPRLPFLAGFASYLVLENEKGEPFILLPKSQEFSIDTNIYKGDVIAIESVDKEKVGFRLLKLNLAKQDLVASTAEDNLAIALTFFATRNYRVCFKHLQKAWQDSPYSEEALEIISGFQEIIKLNHDNTPEAHAICYHLGHLLIESTKITPGAAVPEGAAPLDGKKKPTPASLIADFTEAYENYTQKLANIPHYLLVSPEVELEMLSYLEKSGPLPERLEERKLFLLAENASTLEPIVPQNPLKTEIEAWLLKSPKLPAAALRVKRQQPKCMVNPEILLEEAFLFLYEEASKPDPAAKRMVMGYLTSYALALSKQKPDEPQVEVNRTLLALLLVAVLASQPLRPLSVNILPDGTCVIPENYVGYLNQILDQFKPQAQVFLACVPQVLHGTQSRSSAAPPSRAVPSSNRGGPSSSSSVIPRERPSLAPPSRGPASSASKALVPRRPVTLPLPPEPMILAEARPVPLETKHPLGGYVAKYFQKTSKKLISATVAFQVPENPGSQIGARMFDRLAHGLARAKAVDTPLYALKVADTTALHRELTHQIQQGQAAADHLLHELLTIANHFPPDERSAMTFDFERTGEKREPVTLDDLELFLIQKDRSLLKAKNPFLSDLEIDDLFNRTIQYLEVIVRINQAKNAVGIINKINITPPAKRAPLIQSLGEELDQTRAFDPRQRPEYLFFEAKAEMIMRQKNFETIEELKAFAEQLAAVKDPREKARLLKQCHGLIRQLIMGSGKTKVILPILGLVLANGENLVTIMVPGSLYETVLQQLRGLSQDFFQRKIYSFKFSREMKFSTEQLAALAQRLQEVQETKGCLLVTPESAQSLVLKYVETLAKLKSGTRLGLDDLEEAKRKDLEDQGKILQRILKQFHDRGLLIGDEIDTLLNCRLEKVYPIGAPVTFEPVRWQFAFQMFQLLQQTSGPLTKNGLTPEEIAVRVKPRFLAALLDFFQKAKLPIPPEFRAKFKAYLEGRVEAQDFIEPYRRYLESLHNSNPAHVMVWINRLILAKDYYTRILPFTLEKKCQVNYGPGLNPSYELAVPYTANMQPALNSEFGHPDVLIAFTLQNSLLNGLTQAQTIKLLRTLQKHAEKSSERVKPEQRLFSAWLRGTEFANLNVNTIDLRDTALIERLRLALNQNSNAIFHYYDTLVFPKMQASQFKLSSNPQDIGGSLFCQIVLGFTGTPDNAVTYPEGLTVVPIPEDDGQILGQLLDPLISEAKTLPRLELNTFLDSLRLSEYHAFIDTGALFNGKTNIEAADLIFSKLDPHLFEAIVYFDDRLNQLVVKDRRGKVELLTASRISPERRFTYYDHAHTTGTDVPQVLTAKALMTISHSNSFRDVGQGGARMRKLGHGQQLLNLVPADLHITTTGQMVEHAIQTEAAHLEKDTFFAAKQKLAQIKREQDWQRLLTTSVEAITSEDVNPFITLVQTSLWDTCRFVDTEDTPERILTALTSTIPRSREAAAAARKIISETVALLPAKVPVRAENLALQMEEEREEEEEQEEEKAKEVEHQRFMQPEAGIQAYEQKRFAPDLTINSLVFLDLFSRPQPPNPDFVQLNTAYPELQAHPRIFATENFLHTVNDQRNPINQYMKTAHFYTEIWLKDQPEPLILLLSRQDQDQILEKILQARFQESDQIEQVRLFDHHGKDIFSAKKSSLTEDPREEEKTQGHLYFLAQLQFLQGQTTYAPELEAPLRSWLAKKAPARTHFFAELSRFTYNENRFEGSQLQQLIEV